MPKFNQRSIATKLIIVTGTIITLLLAVSNFFVISQTNDRVLGLVMKQANSEAKGIAGEIAANVGELSSAARTMAGVLGHTHQSGLLDRKGTINILRANLEQNPFAFGSWMAEEPKAFDGKQDDIKKNAELGANEEGLFSPYWSKDRNGDIQFSTFKIDYSAEWYALAAKSLKGAITKPYLADGTDVPTTMSSIAYPVISNGKLIGVSGVDISLASLSKKLSEIKPFGTGRVMLVSQDFKWLVGPSADSMMKDFDGQASDLVKAAISNGKAGEADDVKGSGGELYDRIVYPFDLPNVNARWVVLVDIPASAVTSQVHEQTKLMLAGGFVVLLAALVGLYLAVRKFLQKPIAKLIVDVGTLSRGQYETPVSGQNSGDETGAVATALEGFRHKLADAVRLQGEAEQHRKMSESERANAEKERLAVAALQQNIVAQLGEGLAQLSAGNLTYRLAGNFPGEYAQLKADFDSAISSLQETIQTLGYSASNIGVGTSEITHSASDLSMRTEKQAASLEETAAALDQLTTQVNSSADNARRAATSVETTNSDAGKSGEIVQKAIAAMHGIEQSSQEVSRIIGVIDEIAFQTNLLALNAGVEAARAGDAGKGFAVVAQEVRELAQRSANAAKEIKALINTSATQVGEGVALVGKAGQALENIATQVLQINGLIQQISSSTSEQAVGLREINAAVNQMDQVTQQNAAMVEETTAASATLNEEAKTLLALVARFQAGQAYQQMAAPAPARYAAPARKAPSAAVSRSQPRIQGNTALAQDNWEEF
jgi:methyl-accepting chemotaxis protein